MSSSLTIRNSVESTTDAAGPPARAGVVRSQDGTTIAFTRIGEGPPLILVDAALGSRAFGAMVKLAPLLAERFSVYTYDRRGRGASSDSAGPYAVEREVEDLEAVIAEAGGSAFVYGISSGGALALEAAKRISSIRSFAVYEAPFVVDDTYPPMADDYLTELERLVAADRRGDAVKMFLRRVGVPAFVVALMPLLPVWSKLKGTAHTLPYDIAIVEAHQKGAPLRAEEWASVSAPALVIAGSKSPLWMRNGMEALAGALPAAQHRLLERQTHIVKPAALAPVLVEYFANERGVQSPASERSR